MRREIEFLIISLSIMFSSLSMHAQDVCVGRTEKIIGIKGSSYIIPCHDMVIMDIETYSKYRYMEKQFHKMDSTVSGYTSKLDSLDKESEKNKALLEEKVRDKDGIIEKYKSHTQDITAVLEKCKTDSEGFVKAYQGKVDENKSLQQHVEKLKRQRKGFLGVSGVLAGVLLLVILI